MTLKKDILLSMLVEGLIVGIQLWLDQFQLVTRYAHIFYMLPWFFIFLRPHIDVGSMGSWVGYLILTVFFLVNATKWLLLVWIYRKGRKVIALLVALVLIALAFLSFPFSDYGL